jgi:hypothetical protein
MAHIVSIVIVLVLAIASCQGDDYSLHLLNQSYTDAHQAYCLDGTRPGEELALTMMANSWH